MSDTTTQNKITYTYFVRDVYGCRREYLCDPLYAKVVQHLTGQKTIDERIRGLIEKLTQGQITFAQTLPPN